MRRSPALLLFGFVTAILTTDPARADDAERFHRLLDSEWTVRLAESPLLATYVGVHTSDDRLGGATEEDFVRRERETRAFLEALGKIDRAALPAADQVSYDLFGTELADRLDSRKFGEEQLMLNADSGFHTELAQLPDQVPLATVRDYENYLARLRQFPRVFDESIALLRRGLARGMTPPRVAIAGVDATAAAHAVATATESVLFKPFTDFPATFAAGERERLLAAGRRTVEEAVLPSYRRFRDFLRDEYLPQSRASLAAADLPDGREYYRYLIRHFTTLDLTPEAIHELGLAQVARIRGEMNGVMRKTGFTGDFAAFLQFLRTDPRFYAKSAEELLREASFIAKQMDGKLPALFHRLPRQPYGVAPVPAAMAPKYTSGRYVSAPVGGTQPGWYWVNTYALDKRPLYNLEALTFHEAVPGHHLQGALSQELEGLPQFRRFLYVDAFGEGWGLYSEWLGIEAGFYTDPYRDFGRLGYEAWRASRLVVDTGLHAFGWSRERAIEYLAANTTLPLHEVTTEIDRYISWPGQALCYYLGFMKIRELRARAEQALGAGFDVRDFHDAVLENGALSLPALERQIDDFVAARQKSASAH
ncbi:MAG: hypothetical protein QG573_2695 [Acidobacteriota bacterium]|nr:hypothetical protein [Acidobacteriota bacterium]